MSSWRAGSSSPAGRPNAPARDGRGGGGGAAERGLRGRGAAMSEQSAAPWEQPPGESARAFGAFRAYRALGPRRSLRAAAAAFYGREAAALERQLDKWSRAFGWVARAAAWDRHLDAEARQAQEQARRDMAERQAREA